MKTKTAYYVQMFRPSERSGFKLLFGFPPTIEQIAEAIHKAAERLKLPADVVNRTLEELSSGDLTMQPVMMFDAETVR